MGVMDEAGYHVSPLITFIEANAQDIHHPSRRHFGDCSKNANYDMHRILVDNGISMSILDKVRY